MAEIASSIATTIFDNSVGTIVRQFGYLWNHKKNIKNLISEVEKLDSVRADISRAVTVAERNTQIVRRQVNNWQNNAEEIGVSATEIIERYEEDAKKRCLIGLCPNLVSLYRDSRKASKKQIEIIQVRTEAAHFNVIADRTVRQVPATLSTKGYLTIDSRNSILEEIVEAMKKDTVNSIGVYGLGGMGKTTLAKQVALRVAEEKMFDNIVMAPVTQSPNLKEIQGAIARSLDLKLEGSSVAERAGNIFKRMKEKKILVILDDLWGKLDLEKVGIPFGPEHKGCKLLFTFRFRDVLSSMGTSFFFHLGALEEEEAWSLFAEKTVNVIKDSALLYVGKEVAKKCVGLPVLIVTVAASLSSRPSLPAWKDALKELKRMNNKELHEIVNSALEFISYRPLQKTHKRLFLLCGLLGSGFSISDLLKYSWGWNFFDEYVVTLEDASNKMHALILDLKASCLLLDGDNEDIINIHDVVRGVAISLARKDHNMLRIGDGDTELIRWPNDDVLRSCTAMFFDGCRDFSRLPERLECPLLEFFFLRMSFLDTSSTISDTFFQRTRELKVLDMTGLCFSGLPLSLSCLENLQTLCLDYCSNLEDISMIGELKRLQVLSFIGADIKELPRGIGQLSELRLLDLTNCSKLKIIPAGLLAGLSNLEELYMRESFKRWEAEEFHSSNGESSSTASLAELKHLPRLHRLEIEIQDAKLLSQDLNFERLERYSIIVGDMSVGDLEFMGLDEKGILRTIGLRLNNTSINHLQGVKSLLWNAESLCLWELNGIEKDISELNNNGFPELKYLYIQTNSDIQYIINVELIQQRTFPVLRSLHLSNLLKLEKICNGQLMEGSFCRLTRLTVEKCDRLIYLFTPSVAMCFVHVLELTIKGCAVMKEIIAKEEGETTTENAIIFPKLRYLCLEDLPNLTTFYLGVAEMSSNLNIHTVIQPLFNEKVLFPILKELKLSRIVKMTEIWNDKLPENSCCNLEFLEVEKCPRLMNLISSNMLGLFRNLEIVSVNDCDLLEVFVASVDSVVNDWDIDEEHNGMLPKLIQLSLVDLPLLRCIWSLKYHSEILICKNLQNLTVEKCGSLKYLFTPSITMGLVRLQQLTIESCVMMKEIVAKGEETTIYAISFPRLRYICLQDLPNLARFCWESCIEFPSLKDLIIESCQQLETFCSQSADSDVMTVIQGVEEIVESNDSHSAGLQPLFNENVLFPSLKELVLSGIFNMTKIWNDKLPENSYCTLKSLRVEKCPRLKNLISSNLLQLLGKLEVLNVNNCELLEVVFIAPDELDIHEEHNSLLPELIRLILVDLPQLRCIWSLKCHPGISIFKNLQDLMVEKCGSLKYLFTPSITMGLVELQQLTIGSCGMMKEIVAEEEEITIDTMIFHQLTYLCLKDLPNLARFCCKGCIEFSSLKDPIIERCQQLETFCSQSADSDVMTMIQGVEEIVESNDSHSAAWQPLFNENVNFPKLKTLIIEELNSIKSIWHNQLHKEDSFCKLASVTVIECANLLKIFPTTMLREIKSLKELRVSHCATLEEIFEVEKGLIDPKDITNDATPASQLSALCLNNLPRLRCIWNKDLYEILSFQSLCQVRVVECHSLEHIFPATVAQCLKQLVELHIDDCRVKRIVDDVNKEWTEEEIKEVSTTFMFPKLTRLHLGQLPQLECFYPRKYTIECPALKELTVSNCDKVSILDVINLSEDQLQKLYSFTIRGMDMMNRMLVRQDDEFLLGIKLLEIMDVHDESAAFPSKFPHSFCNLETLKVNNCSFQEIFPYEGEGTVLVIETEEVKLTQLSLVDLPKLRSIWSKFHPGVLSFRNLQKLKVEKCGSLEYLFTCSIAMGFVQVRELTIRSCVMVKEIIAKEGETTVDTIIFPRLSNLCLEDLPNLARFCSESDIVVPLLKDLTIVRCQQLETFCSQSVVDDVTTSKRVEGNESSVKLHTFMQSLFNEKANFPSLERVIIDNLDNIKSIWHSQLYKEDSFCKLKEVSVKNCAKLLRVFSYTMLSKIQNVKELQVVDCSALEVIFEIQKGSNLKEITDDITVSQLSSLSLYNLPKLRCIWEKDLLEILSFQNLCLLKFDECHSLKHIFPFVVAQCLHQLEKLSIEDCKGVERIVGDDNKGVVEEMEEEQVPTTFLFPELTQLCLRKLPQLDCFYPRKYTMEWPELKELVVSDCDQVSSLDILNFLEIQFEKVSFSKLEELTLSGISNFKEIWNYKLSEEFRCNLKSLVVGKCPHLVNVFSSNLLQLSEKLEELHVNHCDSLEEVFVMHDELDISEDNNSLVPQLINLSLVELPKLRFLWSNYLPEISSFTNLQKLSVERCDSLKYLLTPSITKGLVQVRELTVKSCEIMTEIVREEEGDTIIFPRLSYLCLADLPNLTAFCSEVEEMGSNENIKTAMQPLFNEKANFPRLEILIINNLDNIKVIWHNELQKEECCKHATIAIIECANLLKTFLSDVFYKASTSSNNHFGAAPFYQRGESSVPTEQQSEKFEETTPLHSEPSSLSPASESEDQTKAVPYVEKAREHLSFLERKKEISERNLKMAEIRAQLQALEEENKALEEKNEAYVSKFCEDEQFP